MTFLLLTLLSALLLALWEVQIEGAHGWAADLPTRRWSSPRILRLTGGKPVTGYHLGLLGTFLLLVHLPLAVTAWSWRLEAILLGFFCLTLTLEDLLWFVINPAWGIRKFRKSAELWWHRHWFLGVPVEYWLGFPVGTFLALWGLDKI